MRDLGNEESGQGMGGEWSVGRGTHGERDQQVF